MVELHLQTITVALVDSLESNRIHLQLAEENF
jgi:hypothetical protein